MFSDASYPQTARKKAEEGAVWGGYNRLVASWKLLLDWVEIVEDPTMEVSDDLNKVARLQPYR